MMTKNSEAKSEIRNVESMPERKKTEQSLKPKCPKVRWLKMKSKTKTEVSQYKMSEAETEVSNDEMFEKNVHV